MITHLQSIRVDNDDHETYHYFTNNYNKLKEEPVFGIIFGNSKNGIYLNRNIFQNQNFKYDVQLIKDEDIKDIDYTEYMLNWFPYDKFNNQKSKERRFNLFNTLNKILEEKRWSDISNNLFKK